MIIDDPMVCEALRARLRRGNFSCILIVDTLSYDARTSRFQRHRLEELRRLGAQVFLSQGFIDAGRYGPSSERGLMHLKSVVVNSHVAFSGSANLTKASRKNRELMFKHTGPPVGKILQVILDAKDHSLQL